MKLPAEPAAEFQKLSQTDAQIVVRAIYALDGHMGETFAVTNGTALFLFSKRIGEGYQNIHLPFGEIGGLSVETDGAYSRLNITAAPRSYQLMFTAWDKPALERIVEDWQLAAGVGKPAGRVAGGSPDELSPLVIFCACHLAMMQVDGTIRVDEMASLVRAVKDPYAIDGARRFLQTDGLDKVLPHLKNLDENQKLCLLGNLAVLAMTDGLLRGREQEMLERFREAMEVPPDEARRVIENLLIKNNLSIFKSTADPAPAQPVAREQLTPLVAFCASLQAMIEADGTVDKEELAILSHAISNPLTIAQGISYLKEHGLDALLERLQKVLDRPRRQCLLANLIAVAMADGLLRSREQELMDRFRIALGMDEQQYEALFHTLMLKNCLSLFTEA
ncbi:MAG: TerB family tellurite resistance protein [Verrucomicrobiota bacterium]